MTFFERRRLATALAVATLAALAACGGGDDENATEATPAGTASATPSATGTTAPTTGGGGAQKSPADSGAVPASVAKGYALVWADEFKGTELGPEWVFRNIQAPSRACSPPSEDATKVEGGSVHLSADRDSSKSPNVTDACPHGQFTNAQIGTETTKSFTYGIFAARIKFEEPRGAHGSFWMQPVIPRPAEAQAAIETAKGDTVGKYSGTEIDIIEYFGRGYSKGGLASFVYYPVRDGNGTVTKVKSGGLLPEAAALFKSGLPSDDYHVYSVEWTPEAYVFRIDGTETYRLAKGVSGVPQYVILSLLSSDWELPAMKKAQLPMTMSVDWVRVWQQ